VADPRRRLPHNAPGDLFVDATCIDCDTCRWMAPATFVRREGQASVAAQPSAPGERLRAEMALLSCPTASIGTVARHDLATAVAALPDEIAPGVLHCGYHHRDSYGAAAYLVLRPDGNVLVDSPRFTEPLVRRVEALGGVRWMFLTHRDDVSDHARWRERFGCERVLHERDVDAGTAAVEVRLAGDAAAPLAPDLLVIPTPGHTEGSSCLLATLPSGRFLFTGDHLAWDDEASRLVAFDDACWFDWDVQRASMRRLLDHDFEWVLPGHGRRCHLPAPEMRRAVAACAASMNE
jgi:glyoxylase-like metal-dependent hydrolase (beta-lactamase superfamily II)/ferredoxin